MTVLALPDINTIGVPFSSTESFMQTFTGKMISVQRPDPSMIDFVDIVASLIKQCRFNGHCRKFYSVGEHTVRGVDLIRRIYPENINLARSFFLHDFTEAYVGDIIRPVKMWLPQFKVIEAVFHTAINEAFNFRDFDERGVYEIDNFMAMWEKRDILPVHIEWPGMPSIDHLNLPELIPMTERAVGKRLWRLKEELF
jgi:uncharacterized protein